MAATMTMSSFAIAGGDVAPIVAPIPVAEEVDNSSFYIGLALSAISTRDAAVSMDIFNAKYGQDRLGNITFLAGYNFNQYVAVEGRYTTTFTDEDMVEMDGWSLFVCDIQILIYILFSREYYSQAEKYSSFPNFNDNEYIFQGKQRT